MAIAIHHGSNGSFKTSGVIQDYFIPAAEQGRVVVTNIAGVTRDNTFKNMPHIPDSFDVINVDTETTEGLDKIATWFHWAPLGALILLDEAGVIFPKIWDKRQIESLNNPLGLDGCNKIGRPFNWNTAWQKQRHYNWDIVLTAPNIKYIRDDIRMTCESAYKHRNKALFGPMFKGYKEALHDAQKDGKSFTDFESIKDKRISPLTFSLYHSTQTGRFTDTFNGFNVFASPRVIILVSVAVGCAGWAFSKSGDGFLPPVFDNPTAVPTNIKKDSLPVPVSIEDSSSEVTQDNIQSSKGGAPISNEDIFKSLSHTFSHNHSSTDNDGPVISNKAGRIISGPLEGSTIYISGSGRSASGYIYTLSFVNSGQVSTYLSTDLKNIGYEIKPYDHCAAEIKYKKFQTKLTCITISL